MLISLCCWTKIKFPLSSINLFNALNPCILKIEKDKFVLEVSKTCAHLRFCKQYEIYKKYIFVVRNTYFMKNRTYPYILLTQNPLTIYKALNAVKCLLISI